MSLTTKKNVVGLVASYPFSPPKNGGQIAVFAFTKYLAAQCSVLCFCTDNNVPVNDFQVIPLFPNKIYKYIHPLYALRLRKHIKANNIEFLGFQHHYHAFFLLPFLIGLHLKYFVFSHNIEYQRWRSIGKWFWPIVYFSEWAVYQWVHKIFFISIDDMKGAPRSFKLNAKKCSWVPYPIHIDKCPLPDPTLKAKICAQHGFSTDDKLLLFFGPQTYAPNLEAVKHIVFDIHPILKEKMDQPYKIILCGGGLPASFNKFTDLKKEGIHYLGFVEDIESYVRACDVVLNPVNEGGGVKTKLVEAYRSRQDCHFY